MMPSLSRELQGLMQAHQQALLRYATRLLRNPDLAQDIVQESFIRYVKYRRQEQDEIRNPKSWLYRVVHNLALDHIRKNQRHEAAHDEMAKLSSHSTTVTPEKLLSKRDAEERAWKLLRDLPEREQEIICLKVIDGKSYKQIAEIMELSTSNVGFILHNSLKKLGRTLSRNLP